MAGLKMVWRAVMVVAAVLILLTIYLAMFYAPIPATSVRTAGSLLPSIEGSRITVVGFVTDYSITPAVVLDRPVTGHLSLADPSDYHRYLDAVSENATSAKWWTVQPINVTFTVLYGWFITGPLTHFVGVIANGTNASVSGEVVQDLGPAGPDPDGFHLLALTVTAIRPGEVGLMTAPVAQKIFYFHMPSAWASYLAFGVALAASVVYLRTRNAKYDHWAHSSVEIGVVFATIAILTGPVWAKQEWGVYWRWDDTKLVTTFILWLVYIGYLSLRAAVVEQSTRARVSAVYAILGFITVPMSFLSSRVAPLLQSSHPEVIASESGSLSAEAGLTVGVAVIAFTLLFITMLIKRFEICESEDEIEELKRKVGGEE